MSDALTVCYAVTPDAKYCRMAAASAYSVARSNPGVRIRIVEGQAGAYPYGIKPQALPSDPDDWVLFLDADTWVGGSLISLLDTDADFSARVGNVWLKNQISQQDWRGLFERWGLEPRPGFNSGAFLCAPGIAGTLKKRWPWWMENILDSDLPDPLRLPRRRPWWMLDQFALTLAVVEAGWSVQQWERRQHSYGWRGERPGLIHHYGSKRWKDPFEDREQTNAAMGSRIRLAPE